MDTATTQSTKPAGSRGFRRYLVIWSGQFLSLLGSNLTNFALAVYVYRITESLTTLGIILALGLLPAVLASPAAGTLVDSWGPRKALMVCSAGNVLVLGGLLATLTTGTFAVWHVYIVVVLNSILGAVEIPAFAALVPRLVPKPQLGQANGLRIGAIALSQVMAPIAAGFLLVTIDLAGILIIDIASYTFAVVTLVLTQVPPLATADGHDTEQQGLAGGGLRVALSFVIARRGLLMLLLFLGAINFSMGVIELLITPLVLAFASTQALGIVTSIGGLGMVVTGVVVSITGGPRHRVKGILWFTLIIGGACILGSARPSLVLIAIAAFIALGALGIVFSTSQVIWQTKAPPQILGRVQALVNMTAMLPQLVANVAGGVAADVIFEPAVGRDEVKSSTIALLVGTGPGRGIALMLMIVGVITIVTTAFAALSTRMRNLEIELPDMADPEIDEDSPAEEESRAETVAVAAAAEAGPEGRT